MRTEKNVKDKSVRAKTLKRRRKRRTLDAEKESLEIEFTGAIRAFNF
jgi:hypothetical protein